VNVDSKIGGFIASGYFPLLPGSPAIDGGNPDASASNPEACESMDQFGTQRPIDGDQNGTAICDIGAYETQPPTPFVPNSIELTSSTPQQAAINTSYAPISVLVKNQYNTPLPGASVTFSAPLNGASGLFPSSQTSSTTVITNSQGIAASPSLIANNITGQFTVEASVGGFATSVISEMENYIPVPSTISVSEGNYQETYISTVYPLIMKVLVHDQFQKPYQGSAITFAAPESGASGTFAEGNRQYSTVTDINGIANGIGFTANEMMGSYEVIATVAGTGLQARFVLTNIGPIKYVDLINGSDSPSFGRKCGAVEYPCRSIYAAMENAQVEDVVRVSAGVYNGQVVITKNLTLSGGWNSSFDHQNGNTTINRDENAIYIGVGVTATIERININGGKPGIKNLGTLVYFNGSITRSKQAIYNYGILHLTNVTISQNKCFENCDRTTGILNDGGNVTLKNVSIAENYIYTMGSSFMPSPWVGGVYNLKGTVILQNSILAQNHSNQGNDCNGKITSLGNNIIGINDYCELILGPGDLVGTSKKPLFAGLLQLSDNGGSTLTAALLPSSPAISAGNSAACPEFDQRGEPRGTSSCDIGAFEGTMTGRPYAAAFTYGGTLTFSWPGYFKCASPETDCTKGVFPEVDRAHTFALGLFDFFWEKHQRNSFRQCR
jgi:hypothetical protein